MGAVPLLVPSFPATAAVWPSPVSGEAERAAVLLVVRGPTYAAVLAIGGPSASPASVSGAACLPSVTLRGALLKPLQVAEREPTVLFLVLQVLVYPTGGWLLL